MVNKGKGCISAIFDGSIPIALVKHGLDTVFQKPSEPITPETGYITEGLIANFSGEDNYIDGAWVDRISGYKFVPVSSSAAPVYDATNKLYQATSFGGMKSDFTVTPNENFTLEVVTRDIKNCTSSNMSQYYATMLGGVMKDWGMTEGTIVLMKNKGTETIAAALSGSTFETLATPTLNDNELNTWVWALGSGSYVDGEKIRECANTYNTARGIGLFTHYSGSYTSYYRAKGKIHAIRIYNRCLTDEEIAQNHAEDVRIYGA